jgi:hypothetical protein
MANIRGIRTTDLVSSSLIKRDVFEAIFNFKPYQTPIQQFFMATKSAKYASGNPKFELQEDVLVAHSVSLTTAYTAAGTSGTITLGTTNILTVKVGSLLYNTAANQVLRIDSGVNDGAGTAVASLVTEDGGATITNIATADILLVFGSAFAEGSASAQALSTTSTFPYNYTQIHKKAVHMSGTQMATANYGGSDWTNQRVKSTEEFKLDLERTWWLGVRDLVTTAGAYIRFSGGILDNASIGINNRDQYTGTVAPSEDYFFKTYCKNLFAKGSNRKKYYAGADMLLAINDFSKVKQQTAVSAEEYGVNIKRILTPFGELDLVWHPLFEGSLSTWGVGLDQDNFLRYAYLSANGVNRDMQYQTDIGTVGTDERKDQYLAEVGLHLAGGGQGVHRTLYPGA